MADNVTVTAGSYTAVVASDDVGGAQHQRVKPVWGVDGSVADTSATNPMPITIGTSTGSSAMDNTNLAVRATIVTGVQNAGVVASSGLAITKVGGQITSATTTTLVSTVALQSVTIIALVLLNGALANNLTFQSTTPTNLVGTSAVFNFAAGAGLVLDPKSVGWFNPTAAGTGLQLVTSSAGPLTWQLEYTQG